MRIAVFIKKTTFHKGYSGLETQNKQLCDGLVQKGHKVVVFSPKWELETDTTQSAGVDYIFVKSVYRFLFSNDKRNWKNTSYTAFMQEHANTPFDVVIGQSSSAHGIIAHKVDIGIPVISISHGSILGEIQTFYKSFLLGRKSIKAFWLLIKNIGFTLFNFFTKQREFIHGSDKVVCVSNYVKTALVEETFAPEDKFVVIYNAVTPRVYDKAVLEPVPYKHKVIYIGQISKQKGCDILFDVCKDPRFADLQVHLIGAGEMYDELKVLVDSAGLADKFVLHGQLNYDLTMSILYTFGFSAFVFPTRRKEGLPMVLVEAMFAGLPVVAFDNGGVTDTIIENETGYLIKNENIQDFKNKLRGLLDNSNALKKFSIAASKLAKDRFSLDNMLTKYENLLMEVTNENTKNNI